MDIALETEKSNTDALLTERNLFQARNVDLTLKVESLDKALQETTQQLGVASRSCIKMERQLEESNVKLKSQMQKSLDSGIPRTRPALGPREPKSKLTSVYTNTLNLPMQPQPPHLGQQPYPPAGPPPPGQPTVSKRKAL